MYVGTLLFPSAELARSWRHPAISVGASFKRLLGRAGRAPHCNEYKVTYNMRYFHKVTKRTEAKPTNIKNQTAEGQVAKQRRLRHWSARKEGRKEGRKAEREGGREGGREGRKQRNTRQRARHKKDW